MRFLLWVLLVLLVICTKVLPQEGMPVRTVPIIQSQRSSVRVITITFNEPVIISGDALCITDQNYQAVNLPDVTFTCDGITATWVFAESLPDGQYVAALDATKITDLAGNYLAGNKVGFFYRLYGDTTGDGVVDIMDLDIMVGVWLESPGTTGLDANGDGIINLVDKMEFNKNWGKSI